MGVALIASAPAPADARCAQPPVQFSAAGDAAHPATVPAEPQVYLFAPTFGDREVSRVETSVGTVTLSPLSAVGDFRAYAVKLVNAPAGRTVTLRAFDDERELASTVLRTARPQPRDDAAEPLRVVGITSEYRRWSCSHQRTRNLELSRAAPMYRVEWARTRQDYLDGKREHLALPGVGVWSRGERTIELGHVNCAGHTFRFERRPIFVGVAALRHDGTVVAAPDEPTVVTPP